MKFYKSQDNKTQEKIEYVFDLVRYEKQVLAKFFKSIEDIEGIYEIRVITTYKSIRILCFFDRGNLVVLTNCFIKKIKKTPKKEIKLAVRIKKEYMIEIMEDINMKNLTDFEILLIEKYGEKGTPVRDKYEADSLAFRLGVMLKEARKQVNITQEQLAEKTGTKKSYISRIEKGKSDIQISTYYKLIEIGLGKHLNISIG